MREGEIVREPDCGTIGRLRIMSDGHRCIINQKGYDLQYVQIVTVGDERDSQNPNHSLRQVREGRRPFRWPRCLTGLPDAVIKSLAGHTDIRLTQNVYARVGREQILNAMEEQRK